MKCTNCGKEHHFKLEDLCGTCRYEKEKRDAPVIERSSITPCPSCGSNYWGKERLNESYARCSNCHQLWTLHDAGLRQHGWASIKDESPLTIPEQNKLNSWAWKMLYVCEVEGMIDEAHYQNIIRLIKERRLTDKEKKILNARSIINSLAAEIGEEE